MPLAVVTGVSGSGKSSFVRDVFYEGMERVIDGRDINTIARKSIEGATIA